MRYFFTVISTLFLLNTVSAQDLHQINPKQNKDYRLFYNLGADSANKGDIGSAVLNFKRANILNPGDKETIDNLNKLRASIGVPPYLFDLSPLEKAVLSPFRLFSINGSVLFGGVLFILGSLGITLLFARLIPPSFQKYLILIRNSFIALFCLGLIYLASSLIRYRIDFDNKLSVVTQASDLLDRPSGDAIVITAMPAGIEGVVKKETDGYCLITIIDGHEGWTLKTNITRVWEGIL
jgi:hypothetical protein